MPKKVFLYMSSSFHNAYKHMAANPPGGFEVTASEYMAHSPQALGRAPCGISGAFKSFARSLQPKLSPLYNRAHILLNKPKVRSFNCPGYDLIHSGQSILSTDLPYVMDFEHAAVFSGYNQYALRKEGFVRALKKLLLSKNLKKLTPWSNAARASLLNFVKSPELEEKTETVYPVMTPQKTVQKKKHDGVNFIFVGGMFYEKGGLDALRAFDKISGKFDATLTMVSPVPKEVAAVFCKNPKIRILGKQPYEKVKGLYLESDALVFPSNYDTFGFVIPEAFSFGLPVIGAKRFSTPELVEHEQTGLLVESAYSAFKEDGSYKYATVEDLGAKRLEDCKRQPEEYISALSRAMVRLIGDGSLLRKLSTNARRESLEGKFSPKAWKEKMGRIYSEALRN